MANLYKELAAVYEAMYYSFIDYEAQYYFYNKMLHKYNKGNVLEIGSGTGNLASYFIANNFDYKGLDYSKEMIAIAQEKNPMGEFIEGNMSNYTLVKPVESTLITGRTISYLLTNETVNSTFESIHKNLEKNGLLCFDFIDANQFIPLILKQPNIDHEASYEGIDYLRKSHWAVNMEYGMDVKWQAIYYQKTAKTLTELGRENPTVRTFTLNELEIFLDLNQFQIKEVINRPSYYFPTKLIVAERV